MTSEHGINISYTRTGPRGEKTTVNLFGATPEQAAIIMWLKAEDEWKANERYRARQLELKLVRQKQRQKEIDRQNKLIDEHVALMHTPEITGFRRDVLLRHAPMRLDDGKRLLCTSCYTTDYHEVEHQSFPCDEYIFACDWEPTPIVTHDYENIER